MSFTPRRRRRRRRVLFRRAGRAARERAKQFMRSFPASRCRSPAASATCSTRRSYSRWPRKSSKSTWPCSRPCRTSSPGRRRASSCNFKVDGFDQIDPSFRDEDGAYITAVNQITYAYNSAAVKPEDVPKSALDFLKPQFMGKVITVYPADDDATLYLFHTIVQKYGWDTWTNTWPTSRTSCRAIWRWRERGRRQEHRDARRHRRRCGRQGDGKPRWSVRRRTRRRCSRSRPASSRTRRIRTPPSCS